MDAQTTTAFLILNDFRHAAMENLKSKHKFPALLLFYSFIDVCATLADETKETTNQDRFKKYLINYATTISWKILTPYDLWAARSSLLHAYSPIGNLTAKANNPARKIFYYAWPERKEQMFTAISNRGYTDFIILNVTDIKNIAIAAFNSLLSRVENDPPFSKIFAANAEHLVKDNNAILLEQELRTIEELTATVARSDD